MTRFGPHDKGCSRGWVPAVQVVERREGDPEPHVVETRLVADYESNDIDRQAALAQKLYTHDDGQSAYDVVLPCATCKSDWVALSERRTEHEVERENQARRERVQRRETDLFDEPDTRRRGLPYADD